MNVDTILGNRTSNEEVVKYVGWEPTNHFLKPKNLLI